MTMRLLFLLLLGAELMSGLCFPIRVSDTCSLGHYLTQNWSPAWMSNVKNSISIFEWELLAESSTYSNWYQECVPYSRIIVTRLPQSASPNWLGMKSKWFCNTKNWDFNCLKDKSNRFLETATQLFPVQKIVASGCLTTLRITRWRFTRIRTTTGYRQNKYDQMTMGSTSSPSETEAGRTSSTSGVCRIIQQTIIYQSWIHCLSKMEKLKSLRIAPIPMEFAHWIWTRAKLITLWKVVK